MPQSNLQMTQPASIRNQSVSRPAPFQRFQDWFNQADKHPQIREANAMNLATVSSAGLPSNRMVLLKDFSPAGFTFYTNLESHKGEDLKSNANVALCFYWEALGKQIRIEGHAKPVSPQDADAYFTTRPRGSQIGAWASAQSRPLDRLGDLTVKIAQQTTRFGVGPIPRPPFWSGFCVKPRAIEFWKRGKFRVHSRDHYSIWPNQSWRHTILSP